MRQVESAYVDLMLMPVQLIGLRGHDEVVAAQAANLMRPAGDRHPIAIYLSV